MFTGKLSKVHQKVKINNLLTIRTNIADFNHQDYMIFNISGLLFFLERKKEHFDKFSLLSSKRKERLGGLALRHTRWHRIGRDMD